MSIVPFYREQAAREKLAADGATLDNVRDRHRRAENAWTALADRLQHTDTLREARKTAQLVEETLNAAGDVPNRELAEHDRD